MRWFSFTLAAIVLIASTGCPREERTVKDGKELGVTPPRTTTLEQGGVQTVDVTISRKEFDEDVEVTIENLPEGVTAKEERVTIPRGQEKATFTLEAAEDATPMKDHKAHITAKSPAADMEHKVDFTIHVEARDPKMPDDE